MCSASGYRRISERLSILNNKNKENEEKFNKCERELLKTGYNDERRSEMRIVSQELSHTTKDSERLQKEAVRIEAKNDEDIAKLLAKIDELERRVEDLEKKLNTLEIPETLALGEVMNVFKRNASAFVMGSQSSYYAMLDIQRFPREFNEDDRKLWKNITEDLGINWRRHARTIDDVCDSRNEEAHKFDIEQARKELECDRYKRCKEDVEDILKIVVTLNNIMVIGTYAEQFKEHVNKFTWTRKHDRALAELRNLARDGIVTLQHIDIAEAKEDVRRFVPPEYGTTCMQILDMMIKLPTIVPRFQWIIPKKEMECWKCYKRGHKAANCPEVECWNCHTLGHMAAGCPDNRKGGHSKSRQAGPGGQGLGRGGNYRNW